MPGGGRKPGGSLRRKGFKTGKIYIIPKSYKKASAGAFELCEIRTHFWGVPPGG